MLILYFYSVIMKMLEGRITKMKKLKIWRLILANLIILMSMIIILLITPNEWQINQPILFIYCILILIFNGFIIE